MTIANGSTQSERPSAADPRKEIFVAQADFKIERYLQECRRLVLAEIGRFVPLDTGDTAGLYELMLDYPLRPAKALRPALCVATCMALGGHLDAALPSAAAFELFHNAFLVHDDVEDGSHLRRHGPTLHQMYGVPIAVNVGDGMLALALEPLLDNVRAIGLGGAMRILRTFARMARESAEGQMRELGWIREGRWDLADREYLRMVHKKTGWYSFIAPVQVGAMAAAADPSIAETLGRFALLLGIAFQIQDDILSLEGTEDEVGKDALGDLWEGKYTLPLLHTLRALPPDEKREALAILGRRRPPPDGKGVVDRGARVRLFERLTGAGLSLSEADTQFLRSALLSDDAEFKDERAVRRLAALVTGRGGASLDYARAIARRHARRAADLLQHGLPSLSDSVHKQFLGALVRFVTERSR
jgi:geranylgeranyl diphosphate synthase type II